MKSVFSVIEFNKNDFPNHFFDIDTVNFSDGTIQVKSTFNKSSLDPDKISKIVINATIVDSDGIMALAQIKDIIDHYSGSSISVYLYFCFTPYARYDRRMVDVDSFSLKVFAKMINNMAFTKVYVDDPHSEMVCALIDNCHVNKTQSECFFDTYESLGKDPKALYDFVISPDTGAYKKASSIADKLDLPLLVARKDRDVSTGRLLFAGLDLGQLKPDDIAGKRLVIVDDICDKGGTFVGLAQVLKTYKPANIDLYVTHGIFPAGKKLEHIDNIFVYNDSIHTLLYKGQ